MPLEYCKDTFTKNSVPCMDFLTKVYFIIKNSDFVPLKTEKKRQFLTRSQQNNNAQQNWLKTNREIDKLLKVCMENLHISFFH